APEGAAGGVRGGVAPPPEPQPAPLGVLDPTLGPRPLLRAGGRAAPDARALCSGDGGGLARGGAGLRGGVPPAVRRVGLPQEEVAPDAPPRGNVGPGLPRVAGGLPL